MTDLAQIAQKLVSPTKGIFAADWSEGTATKHFEKNGIESTAEERRKYRQMLFTTPDLEKYISGVILHDETANQKADDGTLFPDLLEKRGILPGVRVDEGYEELKSSPKEKITKGMESLEERLKKYSKLGLKFAKWRGTFLIDEVRPSKEAIEKNTDFLVEYALICQRNGFVPIVEPEVLLDGSYTTAKSEAVTTEVLKTTFAKLKEKGIDLKGMILKPNVVSPGRDNLAKASKKEIAGATLRTLKNSVPEDVPGIAFLSGGQTPIHSTENLNEINKIAENLPWELTFSYARALQYPAIEVYKGKKENIEKAQKALLHRAKMNSLARQGKYDAKMEKEYG